MAPQAAHGSARAYLGRATDRILFDPRKHAGRGQRMRTVMQARRELVGTDMMARAPVSQAVARRHVSEPLLALLHQTGISPQDVDAALEHQASRWTYTLLRKSHVYVRRIRASTGCNVVGISRRYRRLLVDIEQHGVDNSIAWHYRESGRANCSFWCRGTIPDTAVAALSGRPLGDLIQPFPELSATTIGSLLAVGEGWIELSVEPGWSAF